MLLNKITFSSVLFLLINYQDSRQRPTVKRNQTNTDNTAHTQQAHINNKHQNLFTITEKQNTHMIEKAWSSIQLTNAILKNEIINADFKHKFAKL